MPYRRATSATILLALSVAAAGCGGSSGQRTSELRPPAPALISASVTERAILLSPGQIGGGPVTLAVNNQSQERHRVTFAPEGSGSGGQSITLPPGINALLRGNPEPGSTWSVSVADGSLPPASLYVGEKRPSSQNDLMLP